MSTFGEELKRERELRNINLREISESTKINLRYLDALERNEFEHLPGGLFNKGFVRAYAQYIGVDPEAMVNAYLLEEQAQHRRRHGASPDVLRGPPQSGTGRLAGVEAAEPISRNPAASRKTLLLLVLLWIGLLAIAGLAYVWYSSPGGDAAGAVTDPAVERGSSPARGTGAANRPSTAKPGPRGSARS